MICIQTQLKTKRLEYDKSLILFAISSELTLPERVSLRANVLVAPIALGTTVTLGARVLTIRTTEIIMLGVNAVLNWFQLLFLGCYYCCVRFCDTCLPMHGKDCPSHRCLDWCQREHQKFSHD